ncbi:CCA tRNA nucleotidyltransferase [Pseudoramibacter faecis]|uniref:CCA tRNA nucleotidyltransferase n=1 Tax=Pseudoramibacter faecis TaxID=3108534 RepID=UPI002E772359|nr:CCA tRNA nucleotidyltransferase [Pseudoramibacter sp. HA2172]
MRDALERLFDYFEGAGYALYLVGGAVRDALLGSVPTDMDLTTDARPEAMQALFSRALPGAQVATAGARFGTIGVQLDGRWFEITTFRADKNYGDGRHPDRVVFGTSAREDVLRRDFTVNGLLMDRRGVVLDYVGGFSDLKARRLRCIGDPKTRFAEDRLRKWRCVRLATIKGFAVEAETWHALTADADTAGVSCERIGSEWRKLLTGPHFGRGMMLLTASGLWADLIRRLGIGRARMPLEGDEAVMDALPEDPAVRLAFLLTDESAISEVLKPLALPRAMVRAAERYGERQQISAAADIVAFKSALADLGRPSFEKLLALQQALAGAAADQRRAAANRACYARIVQEHQPIVRSELALSAANLKAMGLSGAAIGRSLTLLLHHVYRRPADNTPEALRAVLTEAARKETEKDSE